MIPLFSEYTDINEWANIIMERGEGHTPLNPEAPIGKVASEILYNFTNEETKSYRT